MSTRLYTSCTVYLLSCTKYMPLYNCLLQLTAMPDLVALPAEPVILSVHLEIQKVINQCKNLSLSQPRVLPVLLLTCVIALG